MHNPGGGAADVCHRTPQPGHRLDRRPRSATPSCSAALDPRQRATSRCASARSTRRRAGCSSAAARPSPSFLPHIMLRVRDVMQRATSPRRDDDEPVREVGLAMAREDCDLVPIVDDDGALAGVMTERALARRYIRESRETSSLVDAPTRRRRDRRGARGRGAARRRTPRSPAASGCWRWTSLSPTGIEAGDVVVVGDRDDAQRRAIELGAALIVVSNGATPADEVARRSPGSAGTAVVALAAGQLRDRPHDHAVGAVPRADGRRAADRPPRRPALRHRRRRSRTSTTAPRSRSTRAGQPVGLVTRSDLVNPPRAPGACSSTTPSRRRACPASSRPRSSRSSTTTTSARSRRRCPVRATFDPVGSTATLVVERFRQNGMEPSRPTATLLLGAVLSDTVILNSPTTTERDRAVVEYFERTLGLDAARVRPRDVRGDLRHLRRRRRGDRHARRQALRGRQRPDALHRADRDRRRRGARPPRTELLDGDGRASASGAATRASR